MHEIQSPFLNSEDFANNSNDELVTLLRDAENAKLFWTGVAIIGISALVSAIGTDLTSDSENVKNVMIAQGIVGGLATFGASSRLVAASEKAGAIIDSAKERGLNIIPGYHRTIEIPRK